MRLPITALVAGGLAAVTAVTVTDLARSQGQERMLDDAAIIATVEFAHTADIETSQLAQQKGTASEVKEMGRNFATAHTQAREQSRALAKKLDITPALPANEPMATAHKETLAKLQGLEGAEFDKAYVNNEVAFHQSVIDKVSKTLLPAAQNPEVKAWLEQVTPAFQSHLEAAKALQTKIVALK